MLQKSLIARHRLKFAALALLAGAPCMAQAQTANSDLESQLLIAILVKKGVLTQSEGRSIIQEARTQAAAVQAGTAPAAAPAPAATPENTTIVSSTTTPDGTIHVTYVPKVVRDQIAQQVQQQVLAQEQAQGYAAPDQIPDWVNRLHFYGDFRTRFEADLFPPGNDDGANGSFPNYNAINTGAPFDFLNTTNSFPPSINVNQDRYRFRIRARLGVTADLGDGFTVGFRLATGENDSPVSENQTLGNAPSGGQGGNFSKYAVWVDRAYIAYTPDLGPDTKLTLDLGRFDNPFFSTRLLWADDLGFDGFAASGTYQATDDLTPFLTIGAFPVYNTDFNYGSTQTSKYENYNKWLFAAQAGANWQISDDYAAKFGLAYYDFSNISGKLSSPCYVYTSADSCSTDASRPSFAQNGNTYMALRDIVPTSANNYDTILQYQYYGLASQFRELALTGQVNLSNFDPTHIWLNGEYVNNLGFNKKNINSKAVNNRGGETANNTLGDFAGGNVGYYFDANVGQQVLQQRWDWNAMAGYKYVESDAVVDGFTDSDFGLGGTNLKGYIIGGNLALNPRVWVRLRYMSADSIAGPPYKADVLQLDLNGKF
jgi:hypothetical protein